MSTYPVGVATPAAQQPGLYEAGFYKAEFYEAMVSQTVDFAIIGLDPNGMIQTWNLGAERLHGFTREEATGRSFAMFYGQADRRNGVPLAVLTRAREDGRVEQSGWWSHQDGSKFWGEVVITALQDEGGLVSGFAVVARDRTEQHRLQTELRSSEERHRLLVGQVVDYAIIGLDAQGIIQSWNLGAERLQGYTVEEAVGRSFAMFYGEDDLRAGLPLALLVEARDQGRVEHSGWRIRKDGSRFWADAVITALHDDEGRLTGFAKVTRDLTEQHDLEDQLRSSEERLRLLVGQVVDYVIIALDPQGTIETWNLGAEKVKGYTADEAIGRSFAMFYNEEDRRSGLPFSLLAEARERGRVEHSGWRVRKDGSSFWGDVILTALHDDSGNLTGYAKVTRDRTDVKALADAQDAFFAVFNHDFRTPVTALKGFVEALRDVDDARLRDTLIDRAEANADRLLTMVEGLIEFASQRAVHASLRLDDIDIAQVARDVVRELAPALDPARVSIIDDVTLARANGVAMQRVLSNIVVNALKYSPAGSPVQVTFERPQPGHVQVSVSDRGRGIDAGDLDTIFAEFARGRLAEDDGGTGLGLASVRELVEQQHGRVSIESEVGVGTTVSVELRSPRTLRPEAPGQRVSPSSSSSPPSPSDPSGASPAAPPPVTSPSGQSSG